MKKFKTFSIETPVIKDNKVLFNFSFDNDVHFQEIITFPDTIKSDTISQTIISHISIAIGISYYKLRPFAQIQLPFQLDSFQKTFWKDFYVNGLGEYAFKNKIPLAAIGDFVESGGSLLSTSRETKPKAIIPIGGGKDSCVAIEHRKKTNNDFDLFSFGKDNPVYQEMEIIVNKKRVFIKRELDTQIHEMVKKGYHNGHLPITGIISFILTLVSYNYGYRWIIFSNERSANEGNTIYDGIEINHQYSKSEKFELGMRQYIHSYINKNTHYGSILRGMYEIAICKEFATYTQYHKAFSSCNNNFKLLESNKYSNEKRCGICPKCLSVFIMLHPFLEEKEIIRIFGKDYYNLHEYEKTYRMLLGINDHKPFECVGTYEETGLGSYLSTQKYIKEKIPFLLKIFNNEVISKNNWKEVEKKLLTIYPNKFLEYINTTNID